MISGATGALAVVMVALVKDHGVEMLFLTVILMGIIAMAIGVLKLGGLIRMVPSPVMLGIMALTMAGIFIVPRLTSKFPAALAGILAVSAIVIFGNVDSPTVGDLSSISDGLLSAGAPDVTLDSDPDHGPSHRVTVSGPGCASGGGP
ncbi:MAG: hypothetical protein CL724_03005 [Chloroflexi bacterium]|jgi:SulP family sulfate permease|nr:hypothetical protein [Chloroflexota bacterium]|tara:strand:- start:6260 stop:6700 length:441 start_codon:yes stop_codon:yes gene_type:complete